MGRFIYFCGSIIGGRQDAELYGRIIEKLKRYGDVLTEYVGSAEVEVLTSKWTEKEKYDLCMKWLDQTDVVVAEVTQPSIGVGLEIGRAISFEKKILCLFRESSGKSLSAMIAGADNGEDFIVKYYKEEELDDILKKFLEPEGKSKAEGTENKGVSTEKE